MESNGESINPDYEWKPPTDAERKVALAKRERSDKISKLMADYLLKGKLSVSCWYKANTPFHQQLLVEVQNYINYIFTGYKMLATTCKVCDTIELQDKQDRIHCIACQEIDCQETSKDNPALSRAAANSTLAESSERQNPTSTDAVPQMTGRFCR